MINRYPYIASLIVKHLRQELTVEENSILNSWLEESYENRKLFDELIDEDAVKTKLNAFNAVDRDRLWQRTQLKLAQAGVSHPRPVRRVLAWLPYAAAAILIVTATFAWYFSSRQDPKPLIVHDQPKDIPPGGNRATLRLPDGRMISLDEVQDGIIIEGEEITYNDGMPIEGADAIGVHRGSKNLLELSTPKGGVYQVVLSDGTRVWLNAGSTLKYPSLFEGNERIVELIGEAYFSVTTVPGQRLPFRVIVNGQTVEVLGTQFNISAYPDDPAVKTTLVEGSVSVASTVNPASSVVIKPGQQSTLRGQSFNVQNVDVRQFTAWKGGYFYFERTSFDEMIRQVARWYDVEVQYLGEIPNETFTGKMQRDLSLMTMLDLLDISDATIQLDGQKLVIK